MSCVLTVFERGCIFHTFYVLLVAHYTATLNNYTNKQLKKGQNCDVRNSALWRDFLISIFGCTRRNLIRSPSISLRNSETNPEVIQNRHWQFPSHSSQTFVSPETCTSSLLLLVTHCVFIPLRTCHILLIYLTKYCPHEAGFLQGT